MIFTGKDRWATGGPPAVYESLFATLQVHVGEYAQLQELPQEWGSPYEVRPRSLPDILIVQQASTREYTPPCIQAHARTHASTHTACRIDMPMGTSGNSLCSEGDNQCICVRTHLCATG